MEKWKKELLEELKKERPSYREMIEYCCDSCIADWKEPEEDEEEKK